MTSIQIDRTDGLSSSTAIKGPCKVATTANITLAGEQTIDGVAVVTDERVLVKDQTNGVDNGIWKVSTGVWSRAKDFSSNRDVKTGTVVNVTGGAAGAGQWQVATADPITIGTTSISFTQVVQPFAGLPSPAVASTIPVRNAGNTAYDAKAFPDVRDLLDTAPYVATLAALRTLDTTKDTTAVLTLAGSEGVLKWDGSDQSARTVVSTVTSTAVNSGTETVTKVAHGLLTGMGVVATTAVNGLSTNTLYWVIKVDADNFKLASSMANAIAGTAFNLTGTTNFTVKQLYDPGQNIYVIKTGGQLDGTAGAWVRLWAAPTGQFFSDSGARVVRLNDRSFFGDAAKHNGADSIPQSDWLTAFELAKGRAGGSLMYSTVGISNKEADTRNANTLMVGSSTDGLLDFYNGIAIRSLAKNNSLNSHVSAYAGYFEGYRDVSAVAGAYALELDTINFASTVNIDPFQQLAGQTIGLQLAAGGEYSPVGQFPVSSAINVQYNNAAYRKGLMFGSNSIDGTNGTDGGIGQAIVLATGHAIDYYYAAGATSWRLSAAIGAAGDYNITTFGSGAVAVPALKINGSSAISAIDTDGTLAANSDARLATQKAVKTYADALIAAQDAMVFKGVTDCSANPNYPAADRGHTYRVSVAGKIGGASGVVVEVGDMFICLTDGTASGNQATVGANWSVIQTNIDGAVVGPASSTSGNIPTFNGTSGKILQDGGVAVDTDGTLVANSDAKLATQKAVKTYVDGSAYAAYTPTISANSGTITTSSATARHREIGKAVFIEMSITITTNGTGAGTVIATLPGGITAAANYIIPGRENAVGGKMLQGYIAAGSGNVVITNYDNTYPGSNGALLIVSGTFERA